MTGIHLELKKQRMAQVLGGYIPGPVTNNPIALTWATLEDSTANGVLATLTFTVKENADSGKSAITLTYDPDEVYNIDMTNITFAVKNGSVTINCNHVGCAWEEEIRQLHKAGTEVQKCTKCGTVLNRRDTNALGHSFGKWETVTSPDCTNKGSEKRTCSVCQYTETP